MSFSNSFDIYRDNVSDGMLEYIARQLGLSAPAVNAVGIGWYPKEDTWVLPERDKRGDIIGLTYRRDNGFKFMAKGSKRGLTYPCVHDGASVGTRKPEWVRVREAGVTCPICGKDDWCRVSPDDPNNPSAALCSRIRDGCKREISENNYLHIIDIKRNALLTGSTSALPESDLPILIVEGATDVMAAASLGFVAVGRPSAKGGIAELIEMPLTGRTVIVLGENDAGAGAEGMEKAYLSLKDSIKDLSKLMPPTGIKDLRTWVQGGLTAEEFLSYAEANRQTEHRDPDMLPDDIAYNIAALFVSKNHTHNGVPALKSYGGKWYHWYNGRYRELDFDILRGQLYRFLESKKYIRPTKNGVEVSPYKATRAKVGDILDAFNAWAPVKESPPVWTGNDIEDRPKLSDLILFKNGMLDVGEYMKGNIVLHDPDPQLFSIDCIPYDYDPDAKSKLCETFLQDTFSGDEGSIELAKQWLGYNLVPDTSLEKMMLYTGRPRSGKSTLIDMMVNMLGKGRCCSTDFTSLASPFGCSSLVGKLAAVLGDSRAPKASHANAAMDVLLRIVGQDDVLINPKYVQAYTARLNTRFTIAMNDLPAFDDFASALATRMNILYFPNSVVGREDFSLKGRLVKEAREGRLVNIALEGLKHLRQKGKFAAPERSVQVMVQFRELSSPLSVFVADCCDLTKDFLISGDTWTQASDVFAAWRGWCKSNGQSHGTSATFGRYLMQAVSFLMKRRIRVNGIRQYVYYGLKLNEQAQQLYLEKP